MVRPLKNLCEVAVIGGGLAGLAAAGHAARLGRLVTLFEPSGMYGGLVATVEAIDGLAVPGHFSGQDVAIHMLEEARKAGVQVVESGIVRIDAGERLTLRDSDGRSYQPEAAIVASGAHLRKLGVPGEQDLAGRGVSRCATCDGGFFRGQTVAVIGGGDAAVTEALVLARTSGEVIMVCRSPLKAKRTYIERLDTRENVRFAWDSEVLAILGENEVTGLRLRSTRDGSVSEIACAGVFPFIGVEPNSDFVPAKLRARSGLVRTADGLASADPRIFAAGAVRAGYGGNALEAMAEGVSAAAAAARLVAGRGKRKLAAA